MVEAHSSANQRPGRVVTDDHLDALLAYVDEMIVCFDEVGNITYVSPSVGVYFGYRSSDLVGHSVVEIMHPDDLEAFAQGWGGVVSRSGPGGPQPDRRVRHADGSWVPVAVEFVAGDQIAPYGAGVATVRLLDRTDRVERALRTRLASEDRLVRIANAFVGLPTERFDDGVDSALAEMGGMSAITAAAVYRLDDDGLVRTHQWSALETEWSPTCSVIPFGPDQRDRHEAELYFDIDDPAYADIPFAADLRVTGLRVVFAAAMTDQGRFAGYVVVGSRQAHAMHEPFNLALVRSCAGVLGEAFSRQRADLQLAHDARTDSVTGLANRRALTEALTTRLDAFTSEDQPGLALLLLDVDRFKVVNDSLGHIAGDALLAAIAARLQAAAGPDDLLARFGGDEMAVVLPGCRHHEQALARTGALLAALDEPVVIDDSDFAVTMSGGIAVAEPGTTHVELLRQADAAMFRAKDRGRRRVEVFDDALRVEVAQRHRRENELARAVDQGQLRLHYQPEVDLESGRLVAVEALLRWMHPVHGLLSAAEFIPVAEESGTILELGQWVMHEALRQLATWQAAGLSMVVRVNLSARQVAQPGLVEQLVVALAETGARPEGLCLEITETSVMVEPDLALAVLSKIAGLGVHLAIDDFGTGYSSLAQLKRFPVDVLKIDRSFVAGLDHDPEDRAIVEAIVTFARALGLQVTAEGVETEAQRRMLISLGCERAQGYLFSPARPPEELEAHLDGSVPLPGP